MLQYIRDRATGWVAGVIVTLIIIPFALWGVYDYFTPSQTVAIATVNGNDLGLRRFNQVYQRQRARLQSLLGAAYRPELIDQERLREVALDDLINNEVVVQSALTDGMRIGDAQLAVAIRTLPVFQVDGAFSQTMYEAFLRNQGYSPAGFEFDQRRGMLTEQLEMAVRSSALVTAHELAYLTRLRDQMRRYASLRIAAAAYRPTEVSESEVESYFDTHQNRFVTPELVNVEFIELSRDALAESIAVDEEELLSLYEARKSSFTRPEQREASHILIALDEDASVIEEAEVLERLEVLKEQLAAGAAFEDLAREHSEDPGSAKQGGALGWFGRDIMDPAFEAGAFSIGQGEVSEVIRSAFGLHLIKVTGVQPAGIRDFEEVRSGLLRDYQLEQGEEVFFEQADRLANLAFEHPETLEVAAEALGMSPGETGFITRDPQANEGIAAEPRFVAAAFSIDVLTEGNNSELLDLDDARVVALRVVEHRPSAPQPLDEVRDRIVEELSDAAAARESRRVGTEVVERLRSGESPATIAAELDSQWSQDMTVKRASSELGPGPTRVLFRMPKPRGEEITYDGVSVDSGDFVVIALKGVQQRTAQAGTPGDSTDRERVAAELGLNEFEAILADVRLAADVVIHEQNLQ